MAGKVSVASSRRAIYQPGVVSDVNQPAPQLRQIPVVVMPRQDEASRRTLQHSTSYQEPQLQSRPVTTGGSRGMVHSSQPVTSSEGRSVSHSLSADPRFTKEAEVDALTDLLVQNMNVAGNPDFCGMFHVSVERPEVPKIFGLIFLGAEKFLETKLGFKGFRI